MKQITKRIWIILWVFLLLLLLERTNFSGTLVLMFGCWGTVLCTFILLLKHDTGLGAIKDF